MFSLEDEVSASNRRNARVRNETADELKEAEWSRARWMERGRRHAALIPTIGPTNYLTVAACNSAK